MNGWIIAHIMICVLVVFINIFAIASGTWNLLVGQSLIICPLMLWSSWRLNK